MLIAYEPNSDVLTITIQGAPLAQMQVQGTVAVGFDASGHVVSVQIPDASSVLWERGGQVNVTLPHAVAPVATTTVVETTRVVERPAL